MSADAFARMDRMYRHQRHLYDLSRKPYLLGRGRAVEALAPCPGAQICEVGCGTGRNLVALARRYPDAALFGIDASEEMLKNARRKIERHGLASRVRLRRALAQELDPRASFGLARSFDGVLFSYSLSMMPDWERALERALASLRPGGSLVVVDFSEARVLPPWFGALLRRWLALFEVRPRAELAVYFERLAARERGSLELTSLYRDYALLLSYRKAGSLVDSAPAGG